MFLDVVLPNASLLLELLGYILDDLGKEGACTGGGVEYLYAVVFFFFYIEACYFVVLLSLYFYFGGIGETLWEVELLFEQGIEGTHHKIDYGQWGVPYAESFAHLGIEGFEKVFVEVYDGVFGGVFAIGGEHLSYIAGEVHLHEVVYHPADTGIYFYSCDIPE